MMQVNEPDLVIKIVIQCYDFNHENNYLGFIENYKDAKCIAVVQGSSVGEVVKEIGISLTVLEEYRKKSETNGDPQV